MNKKILIITPKFPYPSTGACELDRAAGIEYFIATGWEAQVITRVHSTQNIAEVEKQAARLGITIIPTIYNLARSLHFIQKLRRRIARLLMPWYLDGAAYEYTDPTLKTILKSTLDSFKPDLVWFDYSYLWPLYSIVRRRKIPIITRSINFEALHFLEEDGRTLWNYIKYVPKLLSEYLICRWSTIVVAITPDEAGRYRKLGAKKIITLPLRGLPNCEPIVRTTENKKPLSVYFIGSTYNVAHNLAALDFLLTKIIPLTRQQFPEDFVFHVFGAKVPTKYESFFTHDVVYHGHVPFVELKNKLATMDIALTPSLAGAGMQQKVFEPLMRGFPEITSPRALAGYDFKNEEHLLLATTPQEFVTQLGRLRSPELRERLSRGARERAIKLFSAGEITELVEKILQVV